VIDPPTARTRASTGHANALTDRAILRDRAAKHSVFSAVRVSQVAVEHRRDERDERAVGQSIEDLSFGRSGEQKARGEDGVACGARSVDLARAASTM
jgi:hypothetical protein